MQETLDFHPIGMAPCWGQCSVEKPALLMALASGILYLTLHHNGFFDNVVICTVLFKIMILNPFEEDPI